MLVKDFIHFFSVIHDAKYVFFKFDFDDFVLQYLKEKVMEPAVNGTKNVIMAAAEAKVRRVVFTSSIGTVYMDPNRSPDVVVDESCWSDLEYCKNTKVFN